MKQFMAMSRPTQRGEIATTLAIISLAVIALGSVIGSWVVTQGPLKYQSRAQRESNDTEQYDALSRLKLTPQPTANSTSTPITPSSPTLPSRPTYITVPTNLPTPTYAVSNQTPTLLPRNTPISIPTNLPATTPTPTHFPTPTTPQIPVPTLTPTLTATPPVLTPTPTSTPLPTASPTPSPTLTPTITPTPTPTLTPTITPTLTPTPTPSNCQYIEGNGALDLVFMPDGIGATFASSDEFLERVRTAINEIKTTNLGQGRLAKFKFWAYTNLSEPTACYDGGGFILCNYNQLLPRRQSCGGDAAVVIVKTATLSLRATGTFGLGWNNLNSGRVSATPHELGHSIASLDDEYSYGYGSPARATPAINCSVEYSGQESVACPKWTGKPYTSAVGCYQVCTYSNWYRSTGISIMYTLSSKAFNPPSLEGWDSALQNY